jgi:hypothetical protein
VIDNSVFAVDVSLGRMHRLTDRSDDANAPRAEACVFSPDGKMIAYQRGGPERNGQSTRIHIAGWKAPQ